MTLFEKVPRLKFYIFSLVVVGSVLLTKIIYPQAIYHQIWIILLFFVVLTLGSLIIVEKIKRKNAQNFLTIYFALMVGRLFISIIFATIFIITDKTNVFLFVLNFMVLYLLFLGFEIYGILSKLSNQSTKGTVDEESKQQETS